MVVGAVKVKNIIFDLDGTLFQTELIAIPAFIQTFDRLRKEGLYDKETPDRRKLLSMFGLTLHEIWQTLLPNTDDTVKAKADEYMGYYESTFIDEGKGQLYEGTFQVLGQLHQQGRALFIASNGAKDYVDHVVNAMGIGKYIKKAYSAGEYNTKSKVQLVEILLTEQGIRNEETWMIGDRKSDIEAGVKNDVISVGCRYGFAADTSEFDGATYTIESMAELTKLLAHQNL